MKLQENVGLFCVHIHLSREDTTEVGCFLFVHCVNKALGHNSAMTGLWLCHIVMTAVGCLFT